MKTDQLKSSVEKRETKESGNTNGNITSSIFRKEWNSTTSGTIVQVVLITLLLGLSQSMRIGYDNQKEKDE